MRQVTKTPQSDRVTELVYCLFFVGIFLYSPCFGASGLFQQPTVDVDNSHTRLGRQLSYIEDPAGTLALSDVVGLSNAEWQPSNEDVVSFGYSRSTYWLRFTFANKQLNPVQRLVVIPSPLLDEVSLYSVVNGQVQMAYQTGNKYRFSERVYPHRNFIFPISIPQQSHRDIYIRVKSNSSLQVPIIVSEETAYFIADQNEFAIKSMYYGMMLIMVLYNFFLYLAIRERAYLYYVGFVSCFTLLQASIHGVLTQFFYPENIWLSQVSTAFLIPATAFFSLLFPMRFLQVKRMSAHLYYSCVIGVSIAIALMLISLFFRTYVSYFVSMVLVLATCFIVMTSASVAMYRGQKSARYFIVAWIMLFFGTSIIAMAKFGFLPRNLFTENGLAFGSALEALLLSFALADRLNQERIARHLAQTEKLREASEREKVEDELIYQMTHHPVSGLPNGVMLRRSMEALFQHGSTYSSVVALVLIKLRNYNDINKTLGHDNGDIAIEKFSRRLAHICSKQSNRVVIEERSGEQIFTANLEKNLFAYMLLVDSDDNVSEQVDAVVSTLSSPLELNDCTVDVDASAGISLYPEYASDSTTLLRQAHAAIDSGDRSVNHLIVTYSPEIDTRNQRKMMLMGELRGAIESSSLSMYFQPKVSIQDNCLLGVEALIRWCHPVLGDIAPSEFVYVAEQGGIAPQLTDWVLLQVLSECAKLHRDGYPLSVAVNISVFNLLQRNFLSRLLDLCCQFDVSPEYVTIEVTETSIMKDADYALEMLNRLVAAGFCVSIDDFGTGYASLSYIQRLPAHEIKIDKSFVSDMDRVHHNAVIVRTALEMCHNLGYVATAEGVETESVYAELQAMGCDNVQGFVVAEPMPIDKLRDWLSKSGSRFSIIDVSSKSA